MTKSRYQRLRDRAHQQSLLLGLQLGLLLVVTAAKQPAGQQQHAAVAQLGGHKYTAVAQLEGQPHTAARQLRQQQHVSCTLEIEGLYVKSGIRKISLGCTGGTILAAAAPAFRQMVSAAPGVQWAKDAHCSNEAFNCMFRVCKYSKVHFTMLRVVGLLANEFQATMCLEGGTDVIISNATFQDNTASFLGATYGKVQLLDSTMANNIGTTDWHVAGIGVLRNASVLVKGCTFTNNTSVAGGSTIRVGGVNGSNVRIEDCTFKDNFAACSTCAGGAVATLDNATMTISGSTFINNIGDAGGGALVASGNSRVTVQQCRFVNNSMSGFGGVQRDRGARYSRPSLQEGGAVLVTGTAKVFLQDSVLTNNYVTSRGGAVAVKGNATATVQGCSLTNNTVTAVDGRGGAIYTEGLTSLSNTALTNNSAYVGGAILLAPGAKLVLGRNVSVVNNTARSNGGGVAIESKTADANFTALRAVTHGNRAPTDQDISVPIERLQVLGNISIFNLTSRLSASEGLIEVGINVIGWFNLPSRNTEVEAVTKSGVVLANSRTGANGTALFTTLKLQEYPGLYQIFFRPKGLSEPTAKLVVNVTGCPVGNVRADTGKACIRCTRGYFSFNPDNTTCDVCPANAECLGQDRVLPLPGFWSSSSRSVQMHRCRNPEACPGNGSNACAAGYQSNLCGVCAWPGWGSSAPFVCRKCWPQGVIIALYVTAGVLMLAFAKVLCFFTLDFGNVLVSQSSSGQAAGGQPAQPAPNELLKPFCIYLQFSFLVASMQGVSWPATLKAPFQALAVLFSPASPQSLSLDCILPRNISLPVPVQVFILNIAMPAVLMVSLVVLETIKAYIASKKSSNGAGAAFAVEKKRLVAQSIIVCFLFYPMMLRAVMGLFACIALDQPVSPPYSAKAVGSWFAGDMGQQCWRGYHRSAAFGLGIPFLVLFILVLPVAMLAFIFRHRQNLYSDRFRHFSFMFVMYRPKVAYFEVLLLLQTSAIVGISVFGISLGVYNACLMLTAVLAGTMVLHAWMRPYTSMVAGRTSLRGLACVTFTSFAALSFLPVGTVYGQVAVSEAYAITAGAFVLAVNTAYIASVAIQLVRTVDWTAVARVARRVLGACCAGRRAQQAGKESVLHAPAGFGTAGSGPPREEVA